MNSTPSPLRTIHTLTATALDGRPVALSEFAGKVLLVVNTASECGFTPQYRGLQTLHDKYAARGFAVLGFPSNDFGGQEPGNAEQIAAFCSNTYGVDFPLFEKGPVKGPNASPLHTLLSEALGAPKWNFHKYLIDKQGHPVESFSSSVDPLSAELDTAIARELGR